MAVSSPDHLFIRNVPEKILRVIRLAAYREGVIPRPDGSATAAARWALAQFAKQLQSGKTAKQESEAGA